MSVHSDEEQSRARNDLVSAYGGYLIVFDEERRAGVLRERVYFRTFTDTLSAPDWSPGTIEVCLLSFGDDEIHAAGLLTRGGRVATAKYRVTFSEIFEFEPEIQLRDLTRVLPSAVQNHFSRVSKGLGGRVPPATWDAVIAAIKSLRPNATADLDRLEEIRRQFRRQHAGPGFEIAAQEKDAVGLALRIFYGPSGIQGRDPKLRRLMQAGVGAAPAPFLKGLINAKILEDRAIEHDARTFGDWALVKDSVVGAVEFERDDERLTILNVNRTSVEHTIGVDLIYYQHTYDSYVVVQYKRMSKAHGAEWEYRPNTQFRIEFAAMKNFRLMHSAATPIIAGNAYRLGPEFLYFKFADSVVYDPASVEMIGGLYVPLEYFELLEASGVLAGPKGGTVVSYETVPRHISNSLFISLVEKGWIGSRLHASAKLTEIIRNSLESGRSVLLAKTSAAAGRLHLS